MRPLEYAFPHQGFADVRDEFMMGDDLLVAPVLEKDGTRRVSLPPGRWHDDLGAVIDGPADFTLERVPLSRLPHYERLPDL